MKVYKGTNGLRQSWQYSFNECITCDKCAGKARIMFSVIEDEPWEDGGWINELHCNMSENKYWPHDAIACAVYCCEDCFHVQAEFNQA